MISIFERDRTSFNGIGLGVLTPTQCSVTEELNGNYELELIHPYDDTGKWKRLQNERIIVAPTPTGLQPFRIYRIKSTLDDGVTVNAKHIFYDLTENFFNGIEMTGSGQACLSQLEVNLQEPMPFTLSSDIQKIGKIVVGRHNIVQELIGEDDERPSFLQVFGGTLLRDKFDVKINSLTSAKEGPTIRYGKNLTGLEVDEDYSEVVTRYRIFGAVGTATIDSGRIGDYLRPKIGVLEDSDKSIAELTKIAKENFENEVDLPKINIRVDFVNLSYTEEYTTLSALENVKIGDIVTVVNNRLNFSKKATAIRYKWDALLERYEEIELGDFADSLTDTVSAGATAGTTAKSAIASAKYTSTEVAELAIKLQQHIDNKSNPHRVTQTQLIK